MIIDMSKYKILILFFGGLLISSCSVSKKSLVNELKSLKEKNRALIKENDNLNKKLITLENALEESKNEIAPQININPILDVDVISTDVEVISTASQLSELENYFKQDAILSSKFESFKQGGIEKYLKVSYSDMQRVITEAKTYIGTKHVMGGISRSGIDCSGLLYVSFRANGITNVPRSSQDFARYGNIILNPNDINEGDLVFFTNTYRTSKLVSHVGICIGNGQFIHTSASKGVRISKINDPYYWREHFLFGTRIIN